MIRVLRFPTAVERDPAIDAWMRERPGALGAIAERWFELMRACGEDVRELLHDGHPTACVGDAAFAYVNAFTAHVNVGLFRGAELADPEGLLEGTGKFMRHVKLGPGREVDAAALRRLIESAYADMKGRMEADYLARAREGGSFAPAISSRSRPASRESLPPRARCPAKAGRSVG